MKSSKTKSLWSKAISSIGYRSGLVVVIAVLLVSCSKDDSTPAPPKPTITSISAARAVTGMSIDVTGSNLSDVSKVEINGTAATISAKSGSKVTVVIPDAATTGKVTVTTPAGSVTSTDDLTIVPDNITISDFEEADADAQWHVAQDGSEITTSEITNTDESNGTHYFHVVGSDVNGNYWLGGRYHETAGSTVPFGLGQTDTTKVYFNVRVKKNNANDIMAKLVFAVYEAGHDEGDSKNRRTYEIDFPVTWDGWKTISIRCDKFHFWNGSGFTTFVGNHGDITSMWSLALYITGGTKDGDGNPVVGDFSFDDVVISQKGPLGEEILNP